MKQRKPKLDVKRIPYAMVSVDKLIEIAERIVALELKVKQLLEFTQEVDTQIVDCIVPHISDFRDGKIFIRAQGEDGAIYRAEVHVIGEIAKDPEYN